MQSCKDLSTSFWYPAMQALTGGLQARHLSSSVSRAGGLTLIQRLAKHGFDHALGADAEFFCASFQIFELRAGEVDVDALDGFLCGAFSSRSFSLP